ncbi:MULTISPECIES: HlyD family type I secretion periplasmic adaptor subunit [unclassified Ensifer]|uniref:HlyD family type I secretion periplasmic adaptor subunit n=1 Tax=unclassified Ensifer TaxID=2633371 RepID=UPI0008139766|nr:MULTISPECIES: HlyD family type I secretion periplasmic adaptor subunit [unclassified Ensifer]OCP18501.1 secretion protein HylD [Ensifer sp. LC54]OCP20989.1 secretion protein HylD [Ensifer sp. LC384]
MSRPSSRSTKQTNRADNEFLPAAIEILETPASPVRAAMIWLICVLAALALIWAYFGKFDIVATAQGKIQPVGRVKIVQSEEPGRVTTANAVNGIRVQKGEVLVELDPTTARAEEQALKLRLDALQAEIVRRQAQRDTVASWAKSDLWASASGPAPRVIAFPTETLASTVAREQQLYDAELAKLSGAIANLKAQYRKSVAQVDRLEHTIVAQQTFVSTLSQRVSMRSRLVDVEVGTKAAMIDAQETLQEAERDLVSQKGEHQEAKTALDVLKAEADSQFSTFQSENMQRLAEAMREADQAVQELAKASRRLSAMTIRSPETGVVQASAITTVGQVLTPGTELMRIVPSEQKLEIEAYLPNRDIGFVEAGHEAVIKVEAFPFTRYGILHGKVIRVATDAIPEPDARQLEEMSSGNLQSAVPVSNAQRVQNLVYPVIIEPIETDILVDGKAVPLAPGMTLTIEIKTGQRRILEYLFSPLAEVASGAMKER